MKRMARALTLLLFCTILLACDREIEIPAAPEPTPVGAGQPDPVVAAKTDPSGGGGTTPTPPGPTPTPDPQTTNTYIFQNVNICADVQSWDPNTTIIKTYANASNSDAVGYFLLRWDGAFICNTASGCAQVSMDQDIVRSDIGGVVCRIHIVSGQYAGVTL